MTKPPCVTKQKVKEVMEEVGELDLPDGNMSPFQGLNAKGVA